MSAQTFFCNGGAEMTFADWWPFAQVVIGAVCGGLGAYWAIRERLAILETKHAESLLRLSERIAFVQATADRAHSRIDTWHGNRHLGGE